MPVIRHQINPIGKQRLTHQGRFSKEAKRWYAYRDIIRAHNVQVPESGAMIIFYKPMPKSWSAKKKEEMAGKPMQQTPDVDNLLKGLLDAVYNDDACVFDIRVRKLWAYQGAIEIIT